MQGNRGRWEGGGPRSCSRRRQESPQTHGASQESVASSAGASEYLSLSQQDPQSPAYPSEPRPPVAPPPSALPSRAPGARAPCPPGPQVRSGEGQGAWPGRCARRRAGLGWRARLSARRLAAGGRALSVSRSPVSARDFRAPSLAPSPQLRSRRCG